MREICGERSGTGVPLGGGGSPFSFPPQITASVLNTNLKLVTEGRESPHEAAHYHFSCA
jgi:hypothetical protein